MLLDDQALFRTSLSRLLDSQPGLEVVGECGSAAEALEILRAAAVDVVLLDFAHAVEGDGFVRRAQRVGYQGRCLIVAEAPDTVSSANAIRLGASGIFLKTDPPDRLIQAITLVANGAAWLDRSVVQFLAEESAGGLARVDNFNGAKLLSDRQWRVLLGILGGLTNRKIGENLGLSESTVKASLQELFHRAHVRTRSQLVRAVLEGSLGTGQEIMKGPRDNPAT